MAGESESVAGVPGSAAAGTVRQGGEAAGVAGTSAQGARPAKKPELLAPAGGWEQLEYAVRFGADAVYLAAGRFGMRQRADNFTLDDLPRAVAFAHEHGVKVHVTCNIQMYENDLADLPAYMEALEAAGADAVLVGDLGALRMARRYAPDVAVHVSTQASVSNSQAALTWADLGAKRIVCAREMSLEAIAQMRAELPPQVEIETFVHGSMCMAVSGRCLISDFLTGRSGVTGNCTQPCRWKYALEEEKRPGEFFPVVEDERGSYILNAKDMNMLGHLDELARAGVDSVKIEGRNKKAFYVATVVNAYRQVLDGADPAAFQSELDTVSHRPYSTGFYFGPAHQTPESDAYIRPYDWAVDVAGSEPAGEGTWRAQGTCRNRFWEGSEVEVLSPHEPVRSFTVRNLRHMPEDPDTGRVLGRIPVDVANRTMERYAFDVPFELHPHDIVRIKRAVPTTK